MGAGGRGRVPVGKSAGASAGAGAGAGGAWGVPPLFSTAATTDPPTAHAAASLQSQKRTTNVKPLTQYWVARFTLPRSSYAAVPEISTPSMCSDSG